ncbi:DNA polymerase IV [Fusibacter ferrireducens]|uniref:DNA polymerase IV n=1 Tax=Fusibacter ferrireducens TaxID=2785058 RepID=A0ABS0A0J2_9FIRM|nr:DNA polymerase IV [Fusibacter ferrireducens]MBF4695958.1 DNA polymerase IV [Fusibacter ferrireducens]
MDRQILHFDIDAFFASVEQLDHPEYQNKPLIVGGDSDRGVVATCSYEARKFGVRSAMSAVVAKKLCPNGIFVSGNMKRYQEVSRQIFEFIKSKFDHVEIVSIDEAYIDITECNQSAIEIAMDLKRSVNQMTGLTVSVGLSYNKFLAKLASDWNKPDGIFVIKREDIPSILLPLPIIRIHGLGKKTCEKLNNIGIFTIEDLYQYPQSFLNEFLGELYATEIYHRIHGIDHRTVEEHHDRKSYGKETTLQEDTTDREIIKGILDQYLIRIREALEKRSLMAKTITIKIKYQDFEQFTRSYSLEYYTNNLKIWREALNSTFELLELDKPVRLVGLTLSNFEDQDYKQFNLLESI